jgi:hypothetical protein
MAAMSAMSAVSCDLEEGAEQWQQQATEATAIKRH